MIRRWLQVRRERARILAEIDKLRPTITPESPSADLQTMIRLYRELLDLSRR